MRKEQAELPLEIEAAAIHRESQETIRDAVKALDRARRSLAPIAKSTDPSSPVSITKLQKVIASLQPIARIISTLESQREASIREQSEALAARREALHRLAKGSDWNVRRLKDYDFIGCFHVKYRRERVTVRLGSEVLSSFDEADGTKLFFRLQDEKKRLDGFPFVREDFFRSIRGAMQLARIQQKDQDGKVQIRTLYPLVVLVRQSLDDVFIKRPVSKSFAEYPMAQFIYDLARFGNESWATREGRLRSQGPNMASIIRGATVTLPTFDGRDGDQIGVVWIQRD